MSDELNTALIVGVNGISGSEIARRLATRPEWRVLGLSRSAHDLPDGVEPIHANLQDPAELGQVLSGVEPTHVFFNAWARQKTEVENCAVNEAMVRNLFSALAPAGSIRHAALLTGLKHYMGPFEAFGTGKMRETPFTEEMGRLPGLNFYYNQEDALFEASERDGFTWSVHRAHTMSGYAVGNAMNFTLTLAVQAALARELRRPLVFPGTERVWNFLTDVSDAAVVADQMIWASTTPGIGNEAWNVANGEIFRWRWLWPRLAAALNVEWEGFEVQRRPLVDQMSGMEPVWEDMAAKYALQQPDLHKIASFWHTDSDLGVEVEVVTGMTKSRLAGFTTYISTERSFIDLFDRYEAAGLVPPRHA